MHRLIHALHALLALGMAGTALAGDTVGLPA